MRAERGACGRRGAAVTFACVVLAGCAEYKALPLAEAPVLARNVTDLQQLEVDPAARPLDGARLVRLAVDHNPDLKAARKLRNLAQAQVLQAGLLPNPQVSFNYAFLIAGPATVDNISASVGQDIKSVILRPANIKTAEAAAFQIDADLLWQEWQLVGRVRLLYVDIVEGERLRRVLAANQKLLADRYRRGRNALATGDVDLSVVAPDLAALSSVRTLLNDLERQLLKQRFDLDALLGLAPSVRLALAGSLDLPVIDRAQANALVASLGDRRPDLVALRLGYGSQDAKLRAAILGQFPAVSIGAGGTRDPTDVRSLGPQINFEIPIFNHNQGNIAIETATREKLHDEFTARLAQGVSDIESMLADQALIAQQLKKLRGELAEAERISADADKAFKDQTIDARTYTDLAVLKLAKQQEIIVLERTALEQRVAIATLVGAGMPKVGLADLAEKSREAAR